MSLSLEGLKSALDYPNVVAMLRVIRERESGQGADAYTVINGGAHFSDLSCHPFGVLKTTEGGKAAGAYQFLPTTWGRLCEMYGFDEFGPATQDLGAVALMQGRGALRDVIAGRFEEACIKLRPEWTSLPGAAEGAPGWTMNRARTVFVNYGGRIHNDELLEQPVTVTETDLSDVPPRVETELTTVGSSNMPIFAALLPSILGFIPELIKIFGSDAKSEVAKRNVAVAGVVSDAIVKATGSVNLQAAVEAMGADPAVAKAARAAVVEEPTISVLLEISGAGIDKARAANTAFVAGTQHWWQLVLNPVLLVTVLTLPLIYIIVWYLVQYMSKVSSDVIAQTIGTIVGLVLGGIMGFWTGQTYTQSNKRTTDNQGVQA